MHSKLETSSPPSGYSKALLQLKWKAGVLRQLVEELCLGGGLYFGDVTSDGSFLTSPLLITPLLLVLGQAFQVELQSMCVHEVSDSRTGTSRGGGEHPVKCVEQWHCFIMTHLLQVASRSHGTVSAQVLSVLSQSTILDECFIYSFNDTHSCPSCGSSIQLWSDQR